jgi:hypothetical protein
MSPDITMCQGTNCPFKDSCYRHKAKPNEIYQSWFVEPPIKDGKCDMYWGKNAENTLNQLKDIMSGKQD